MIYFVKLVLFMAFVFVMFVVGVFFGGLIYGIIVPVFLGGGLLWYHIAGWFLIVILFIVMVGLVALLLFDVTEEGNV